MDSRNTLQHNLNTIGIFLLFHTPPPPSVTPQNWGFMQPIMFSMKTTENNKHSCKLLFVHKQHIQCCVGTWQVWRVESVGSVVGRKVATLEATNATNNRICLETSDIDNNRIVSWSRWTGDMTERFVIICYIPLFQRQYRNQYSEYE